MKSKGGTVHVGDVIPYIFCLGTGGESSKADRARHPDEVRKAEKDCLIGAAPGPSLSMWFFDVSEPYLVLWKQITIIICPSRYCHRLKGCARGLRELIVCDLRNALVSEK